MITKPFLLATQLTLAGTLLAANSLYGQSSTSGVGDPYRTFIPQYTVTLLGLHVRPLWKHFEWRGRCNPRSRSYRPTRAIDAMRAVKYVYWQENSGWMGYLQDFPDYWTQGETLDDLKEHLRDLYADLTESQLPGIRQVDDLVVS